MPLTIPLPPDLEARLAAEAARVGVAPERLAAGVLDAHLPADRRTAALALLDSWRAGADAQDQREAGEALVRGLNATRAEAGERLHFPPELEGVTW
jgi:hypothetical protein